MPTRAQIQQAAMQAQAEGNEADVARLMEMYHEAPEDAAPLPNGYLGKPMQPTDAQGNMVNSVGRVPTPAPIDLNAGLSHNSGIGGDILNFLSAHGRTFDQTQRGARQMYHEKTGNQAEADKLGLEEERARKMDEALLNTKAGKAGSITGYTSQALLGTAAAAAAPEILGLSSLTGAGALGAEGVLGYLNAAIAPTVKGEDRDSNGLWGAGLNMILPGSAAIAKRTPYLSYVMRHTPDQLSYAAQKAAGKAAARIKALEDAAGEKIGELSKQAKVRLTPMVREMEHTRRHFGAAMEQQFHGARDNLDYLINLGRNHGGYLPKHRVQELRTSLLRNSQNAVGYAKTGFENMRRLVDDAIDKGMPTPKHAKELALARSHYRDAAAVARAEALKELERKQLVKQTARVAAGMGAEKNISH